MRVLQGLFGGSSCQVDIRGNYALKLVGEEVESGFQRLCWVRIGGIAFAVLLVGGTEK